MTDAERAEVVQAMSDVLWAAHGKEHSDLHESITLAREDMARRLEGMNEFRRQITEAESKFVTRTELESLERQVRQLERLIWMATGGLTVIMFAINFLKK